MAVSTGEHVLAPVQQRGQAALGRLGLPTRKQEAWRLTNRLVSRQASCFRAVSYTHLTLPTIYSV